MVGSRLRTLARSFYEVPWCVPAWGRRELAATLGAVARGRIVRGPAPAGLEEAVRRALGVRHALAVNRGRTAIELALRAQGAGPGTEVVLPSYVCRSVLEAVERSGASPVFADIGEDLHVTAGTVAAALSPRTRCVIVPHLDGKAAPIDRIEESLQGTGIGLVDDAAQSFGATLGGRPLGTFGACGIVSCGAGKPLAGAAGGLLVTNDTALFERAGALAAELGYEPAGTVLRRVLAFWIWRRLRRWTLPVALILERLGGPDRPTAHMNGRLANLDAEIMLRQLDAHRANTSRRRENLRRLAPLLEGVAESIVANAGAEDVALRLVVILPSGGLPPSAFLDALAEAGVEAAPSYTPLHRDADNPGALPALEAVAGRVVWVPVDRAADPRRIVAALAVPERLVPAVPA